MNKWLFLLFLVLFLQSSEKNDGGMEFKYKQGKALYDSPNPTKTTDSLALAIFQEIIASPFNHQLPPEFRLDVFEKSGNLALMYGKLSDAISYYWQGLNLQSKVSLSDTLFFGSNLFLGETYYLLGKADSSIYFLEQAEMLLKSMRSNAESARLFNSLGVIYFESGNYIQAINYFTKAKNLLVGNKKFSELDSYNQYALFSFQNNIGSSLLQLNLPDSALHIYRELENSGLNMDQVNAQMASIFLDKHLPDSALNYLNKISSDDFRQSASYKNQLAEIFWMQKQTDQAKNLLLSFVNESEGKNSKFKDFRLGRSYSLLGKIAFEEKVYTDAVNYFQKSIIHLDGFFDQSEVFVNPVDFSLGFATFSLIESIVDKAHTFYRIYKENQDPQYFDASIATFQTAFDMVYYVSNNYDNDEARIFLGDFALDTFRDAVQILISEYQVKKETDYLFKSLEWAESSKSIALNSGIKEKKIKRLGDFDRDQLIKERDLQFAISRIQQSILQTKDEAVLNDLQATLTDTRLQLSRLHNKFRNSNRYLDEKVSNKPVDIQRIQEKLLHQKSLIISLFETDSSFLFYLLDKKELAVISVAKDDTILEEISLVKNDLVDYQLGRKYETGEKGFLLYKRLLGDFDEKIADFENLIIIPHGVLVDFPFEVLENKLGEYLIQSHAISYQYSLQLLTQTGENSPAKRKTAGFAPFVDHGWKDEQVDLSKLPYSKMELEVLDGEKFIGSSSTKEALLAALPDVAYLQLSTHAIPDPQNPGLAFITLYPGDISDRLYTNEVASMDLSHTSLVFLSACETNFGSTSRSEGVLSISRAFMLAGCQNIVSSLWKAEDKVAAYLSAEFYRNVENGMSYSQALQLSKLKLLSDPQMSQFQHPYFWSNLMLVGELPKDETPVSWFAYGVLLVIFLILVALLIFRNRMYFNQKKAN